VAEISREEALAPHAERSTSDESLLGAIREGIARHNANL